MDSKGADLGFAEGSWAAGVQDFVNSGTGSKSFTLDQIAYEGEELSADGKKQLDDLAALLKSSGDLKAEVRCHSREAKNAVGRKTKKAATKVRALWVKEKIKARGVDGSQLSANGMADEELLDGVPGDDDAQRRITVMLTK